MLDESGKHRPPPLPGSKKDRIEDPDISEGGDTEITVIDSAELKGLDLSRVVFETELVDEPGFADAELTLNVAPDPDLFEEEEPTGLFDMRALLDNVGASQNTYVLTEIEGHFLISIVHLLAEDIRSSVFEKLAKTKGPVAKICLEIRGEAWQALTDRLGKPTGEISFSYDFKNGVTSLLEDILTKVRRVVISRGFSERYNVRLNIDWKE